MNRYYTSDEYNFINQLAASDCKAVNRMRKQEGLEPINRYGLLTLYIRAAHKRQDWGRIDGAAAIIYAEQRRDEIASKGDRTGARGVELAAAA